MMNDKKNIDRLFQEKFKDFEVTPEAHVWEKIRARQNKNKKRALVIPFWYKAIGIAALIALLLNLGYRTYNQTITQEQIVTRPETDNKDGFSTDNLKTSKLPNTTDIVAEEKETSNYNNPKHVKKENSTKENVTLNSKITSNQKHTPIQKDPKKIPTYKNSTNTNSKKVQVAENTSFKKANQNKVDEKIDIQKDIDHLKKSNAISENEKSIFVTPSSKKEDPLENNRVADTQKNQTAEKLKGQPEENIEDSGKKSIFDAIDKAEKEEVIVAENQASKKWNISPSIAPVYYDAIGDGSSIDPQFADNTKNGGVNLSYGVQIAYTVNDRLTIRSGVHKLDLSYATEDIGFNPSTTRGQNIESINYAPNSSSILISDFQEPNESFISDIDKNDIQNQNLGLLSQSIDYIEVPLEMKYAITNKKIGFNVIGGVSTLFLQNNEISIEAGDFETSIGEANNLNEVSFSGNIGLGVDYKISDQFKINLEPIFKYQFNAFTNTENFKPYYFGVYTGVSIQF